MKRSTALGRALLFVVVTAPIWSLKLAVLHPAVLFAVAPAKRTYKLPIKGRRR